MSNDLYISDTYCKNTGTTKNFLLELYQTQKWKFIKNKYLKDIKMCDTSWDTGMQTFRKEHKDNFSKFFWLKLRDSTNKSNDVNVKIKLINFYRL